MPAPRRIALINQKGGVGKTTTTVNLGAALARAGRRVLLFDLDPQSHLTMHLGLDPAAPGLASVYDVLAENRPLADAVHATATERVSVAPATIDLAAAEVELVGVVGREVLLRDAVAAYDNASPEGPPYDYLLLDCPPSLGLLTLNALSLVDEIFICLQPHFLALQGVGKLLETVSLVQQRINPKLRVTGVVLCMYELGTKLAGEVTEDLENFLIEARAANVPWSEARVFKTIIRRNIKLAECPSFGQVIYQYAPASHGAYDYGLLASEVLAMEPGAAPAADGPPPEQLATQEPATDVAHDPSTSLPPPAPAEPEAGEPSA